MNSSDGIATDPAASGGAVTDLLARRVRIALTQNGASAVAASVAVQVGVTVGDVDIAQWLQAQPAEQKTFWEDRDNQFAVAGIGSAHGVYVSDSLPLGQVCERIRQAMMPAAKSDARLRYYGGIRFNPQEGPSACWKPFGTARFVLPRVELRREGDTTRLLCNLIPHVDRTRVDDIVGAVRQLKWPSSVRQNGRYCPDSRVDIPNKNGWSDHVEAVLGLLREDYGKVVLARESAYSFEEPLAATALFQAVREATPGAFHFLIQPSTDTAFVGASPERLFSKRGRRIYSEAIAGTRPRGKSSAADREFRRALLSSDKDRREHAFVRTSLWEGLQELCDTLETDEEVAELKLPRNWHLIARMKGSLRASVSSLDVLAALHPSPAVGGWPTEWAVDQIEENESFDRGWYAGPVGWLGHEDAEFAVAIRSGLVEGNTLRLYSGAGIVEGSDPEVEWNEIEQKISDFIDALGLDC